MKKLVFFFLLLFAIPANSSDYFDYSTGRLTSGATARAGDVNTIFDEIDTGLDLLPTEDEIKGGLISYGTDSGAADAHVVTMPYTKTAFTDGMEVAFKAAGTNTGAATVDVDSLGVKSIKRQDGTALVAGDIVINKIIVLRYNSTSGYFEIQGSPVGSSGAGTMSTQNASAVAVTGGTIAGTTISTSTLTSPVINTGVSGTAFLDEDNMASDSATKVASQQSIKAFVTSGTVTMTNKTLTSPKINEDVVLTAVSTDLNQLASKKAIIGDATAGRVLRKQSLLIQNGTTAATIHVSGGYGYEFNNDSWSDTNNVAKNATTGSYTLSQNGNQLSVGSAEFPGDCVMVMATIAKNASQTAVTVMAGSSMSAAGDVGLQFSNASTGADVDLTTLVDTGLIAVDILYLTSV